MKYKVGDKVRVRINLKPNEVYGDLTFLGGNMSKCAGQICTIKRMIGNKKYYVSENPFVWSEEMLEPVDSMTLRMVDGTIIGEFNTIEIQPLELVCNEEQAKNIAERLAKELNGMLGVSYTKKEEKKMPTKFTFYVTEGYRIDKSNNTKIPTMTTEVLYKDKDGCAKGGSATCDKTDYDERQGVIEALANMCCDGNFDREYNKAVKWNKKQDLRNRTCRYCGQVFDTYLERIKHMDWHVECRKARHERYRLRKRAKEIAFEEAAQKMAKEIMGEQK